MGINPVCSYRRECILELVRIRCPVRCKREPLASSSARCRCCNRAHAAAAGFRWYDLGEVEAGNEGLADFKSKWDCEPQMLFRYHAPSLRPEHARYRRLAGGARSRSLALGAWRRVPLPLTAFAGDGVHRFL